MAQIKVSWIVNGILVCLVLFVLFHQQTDNLPDANSFTDSPTKRMSHSRSASGVPIADMHGDGRWDSMHAKLTRDADAGNTKPYVFAGDSLIQRWRDYASWDQSWDSQTVNLGIGGDRTEHILWRLQNGELTPTNPKVVVIMAGTNNHGVDAEDTIKGIKAIVNYIRTEKPSARIVVMALLPRGERPNRLRDKHQIINANLKDTYETDPTHAAAVYVLDIGHEFLTPDGGVPYNLMPDYLHMNAKGYDIWTYHLQNFLVHLKNTE
ncbi:hypothetical protein SARC_06531 [Sphaeroforma arctica JP610]|uniref:SGNH hydrolase-type esterase domain-containing protein n=1 Tax=Sphaeroforma arctica JP610 TaxID=667725 RepID=A0A0L0FWE1_9EUKA|nr:hypothetical protein SARC_06531 [Sphaeroforma arctica JP610]KNC81132.1 hypothetical protein SARC_06531 [Sphaeroforma arctica JP610]|eukprot:XP_014155034.1 hypothetical protein SARC_06531 [Sphaeroforma arctica JP610]